MTFVALLFDYLIVLEIQWKDYQYYVNETSLLMISL